MDSLTRRYRVLSRHYDFLEELEKETKEIQIDAVKHFNVFFQEWREGNPQVWDSLPRQAQLKVEPPQLEPKENQEDEQLTSLYKEVAKKTHPDLNNNMDEVFMNAKDALDENDWAKMMKIAEDIGIEVPNPTFGMVQKLERSIKHLEGAINDIRETVIWVWFHEKNLHKRNVIFTHFVNHLAQNG